MVDPFFGQHTSNLHINIYIYIYIDIYIYINVTKEMRGLS